MPNTLQPYQSNYQVTNDPTTTINGNSAQDYLTRNPYQEMTTELLEAPINSLLTAIDDVTGLDLLGIVQPLEDFFVTPISGLLSSFFSFLTPGTGMFTGSTAVGQQGNVLSPLFSVAGTILTDLLNIPTTIINGVMTLAQLPISILTTASSIAGSAITGVISGVVSGIDFLRDAIVNGLGLGGTSTTNTDVLHQASIVTGVANSASTNALSTITIQSQQTIAKPNYLAMDATADAVFPIANLSGPTASTITVTSAASVGGFITTPDNGKKSSLFWLGQVSGTLTGFYVNLYQLDLVSGTCTLINASSNQLTLVSTTLAYSYYNLPTPVTSDIGNVYYVEIVVTGSGSYKIAGIPNDWKPANTVAGYPHQLGSGRTTSLLPAPNNFTPNYTGTVPFFGMGGFLFAGPLQSVYTTPGTSVYPLPTWLKYGDKFDIALMPGAGGGSNGPPFQIGNGGNAGVWVTKTLTYGTDVPTSTQTLTITVGAGGTGNGFPAGNNGGDSTIAGTGVTTVTAPGALGGNQPGATQTNGSPQGISAAPVTYDGLSYVGGAGGGTNAAGSSPGGGGGGGSANSPGQPGGDGAIVITAYQAGTQP